MQPQRVAGLRTPSCIDFRTNAVTGWYEICLRRSISFTQPHKSYGQSLYGRLSSSLDFLEMECWSRSWVSLLARVFFGSLAQSCQTALSEKA